MSSGPITEFLVIGVDSFNSTRTVTLMTDDVPWFPKQFTSSGDDEQNLITKGLKVVDVW